MENTLLGSTAALIAVDLQHATCAVPSAFDMTSVLSNASQLAAAFRDSGRLVVLTKADLNIPPQGKTVVSNRSRPHVSATTLEIVPQMGPEPGDKVITRSGWSAFAGTGLDTLLRERGITCVVVAGLATNYGIESTVRHAYDLDFSVIVVTDAINNPNIEGHQHALNRVLPALATLHTTDEVVAHLHP